MLRARIVASGPLGPALFVLLFSLLQPLGFPGVIFMLMSTTLWPLWQAFLLCWAGAIGAGTVGFGFARMLGRDWVEKRLPRRIRDWDDRLSQHSLRTVILFRLIFYIFPPAHWALGLSRVRFDLFLLGTAIGVVPGTAAWVYLGAQGLNWMKGQSAMLWLALGAGIFVIAVVRRRRKTRAGLA